MLKKMKIETSQTRVSERSPRGSISEKSPLLNMSKLAAFPRPQGAAIDEELSHLPYKENELQLLAKQIGIDFATEKDKYLWFLIQVANLDLPPGWMREEDPSGGIYYHNPNENIMSTKHPMVLKFRALFNEILENEIAGKSKLMALKEKVQKYEHERESRSPRKGKEATIKLDKAKKFKAAATVIAMTAALSSKVRDESPLGKLVRPEPPQSIVDSDKLQERFNKVKEILEKRRVVQEEKVNEIDNLVKTEDILNISKQFYIEEYGSEHRDLPAIMQQIEGFDLIDPMDIIEAAKLFNVRSTQAFLFWTLRAYCGLPLPEFWNKSFDTNLHREIYYNTAYDVKISVRPCYFYVLELINYLKQGAIRDKDSFLHFSNKITLCDKLGRKYDVDLASMIKDLTEKATNERKNYFTYHQKKEVTKEEVQKVNKKRKKDEFNPNYSDAHFIEIANQLGIDLNNEIHLLMVIEDFVKGREPVERWFYRQATDGPSFWVNHEQQKAVNKYPYIKELKTIIDEVRKNAKTQNEDAKKHLKTEFNIIKMLFRKYPEDVGKKILSDEAKNYVEFFLKNKSDVSSSPTSLESKGYNLGGLLRKIGAQLSKHDIMDLLFYCPFDFTQYVGEDFLKSSETYLLKKLRRKTAGNNNEAGSDDDDMEGLHDGSFESQASNDSAKKIKMKIEDSKKLLDLAANIKGLNLDPEKKREFMKLLIDFDQKYGDHDLVDALEQDVTENLKDEAVIIQNLASTLKNKLKKDGQDVDDDFNESPEHKKNKKSGQDITKNAASAASKTRLDSTPKDQTAGKNKKGGETPSNSNATKAQTNNKMDGNVSISRKDGSPTKDSRNPRSGKFDGESDGGDSSNTSLNRLRNKDGSANRDQDDNNTFITSKQTKVKSIVSDLQSLKEVKENNSGAGSDMDGLDKSQFEKYPDSKGDASPSKASSKYVLDENGKIIFTSKKTQELLEGLAEEERTSTKRKNRRGDAKGLGSNQGSLEGEGEAHSSLGYLGAQSQAFDDHEIVYQEIINEKGERILVPINVKTNSKSKTRGSVSPGKSDDRSKSPVDLGDSSHKMMNSSSSKGLIKGSSLRKIPGSGSKDNLSEPLPMVIGSSYKSPNAEKKTVHGAGQWDPSILIESLQRYDHNDSQYNKERRREEIESALRFSHGDDSKLGDPSGKSGSRSLLTAGQKARIAENKNKNPEFVLPQQTYKSLEPGLQHLETVRQNNKITKEKASKLGLWTHVELFEMEDSSSPSHSPDRSMLDHHRSTHDVLKGLGARLTENYQNSMMNSRIFYTPYRKGNLGSKRIVDYLSHLNSLVFMKKLNTLITNFLIKRFTTMQLDNLGVMFKPDDPAFRSLFEKRYRKLIRHLRDNLMKKKEFISHIYTKVVTNGENLQEMNLPGLSNFQQTSSARHRPTQSNKDSMAQSIVIGKQSEGLLSPQKVEFSVQSTKHVSVIDDKNQSNFKLPQLGSQRKVATSRFKTSYGGFKNPRVMTEESVFDDNKFRTTLGFKDDNTWYATTGTESSRIKKGQFAPLTQKQNDAEKILKSLNEYDQENYKHYWNQLGDPLKLNSFATLSRNDASSHGIQPYHILLMANRLGLQVHNGEESDLAWIAYLALTSKLPENKETNLLITSPKVNKFQKMCSMKYGEHPGDKYFKTLLLYQQMRRKILFEYMSLEDQVQYIKAQSWAKLRGENGGIYYYNFSTKQKASILPGDHKTILSKATALASRGEVKEKLKLSDQIVQENDHLLTLFKNKISTK